MSRRPAEFDDMEDMEDDEQLQQGGGDDEMDMEDLDDMGEDMPSLFWNAQIKVDGETDLEPPPIDGFVIHITKACFGANVKSGSRTVIVTKDEEKKTEVPICVLLEGKHESETLNLILSDNLTFQLKGKNVSPVSLTGYLAPPPGNMGDMTEDMDDMDDIDELDNDENDQMVKDLIRKRRLQEAQQDDEDNDEVPNLVHDDVKETIEPPNKRAKTETNNKNNNNNKPQPQPQKQQQQKQTQKNQNANPNEKKPQNTNTNAKDNKDNKDSTNNTNANPKKTDTIVTTTTTVTTSNDANGNEKPLSKNQLKKLKKQAKTVAAVTTTTSTTSNNNNKTDESNPGSDNKVETTNNNNNNDNNNNTNDNNNIGTSALPNQSPKDGPINDKEKTLQSMKNGIQYKDLKTGDGPLIKPGQKLSVYYVGQLDNKTIFDKSIAGEGFEFTFGKGEVIKGWDEGMKGMKVGGKRRIIVPSKLGYGVEGTDGIPPNSQLTFTVEIKKMGK